MTAIRELLRALLTALLRRLSPPAPPKPLRAAGGRWFLVYVGSLIEVPVAAFRSASLAERWARAKYKQEPYRIEPTEELRG